MEEEFGQFGDLDIQELVDKFEKMVSENENYFFDVDDFEAIIEYFFEKNDKKNIGIVIDIAIGQHPNVHLFQLKRAQYFVAANKTKKALNLLSELESIDPANSEIYITRGSIFSQLREFKKSIDSYAKALHYGVEDPEEIFTNIAFEYVNLGDYENAISYLKKVIDISPANVAILYEISFCFEMNNRSKDSLDYFTKYIDHHPYSKTAWFNIGIAYNNLDLYEKAIEAYDFAIAIDETFSSAYFNKANAYANLMLYQKAIDTYRETFLYEDHDAMTHYYIGECYEKLNDYPLAIDSFKKALKIDDDLTDAWFAIGLSYDEMDESQKALPYFKKAIKLEPSNADYWYLFGDSYYALDQLEEAMNAYRKVSELNPHNPDIWLDYSNTLSELNEVDKAIEALEKGINFQPANSDFHYRLMALKYKNGLTKEAYEIFTDALKMDYSRHHRLFKYLPSLENDPAIIELLEIYKNSILKK